MTHINPYTTGYHAAYREVYAVLGIEETPTDGAAVIAVVEILMETLAGKLTQAEFFGLAILLEQTGTRVRDLEGNPHIDIWGEMNGCSEENNDQFKPEDGS